MTLRRDFAHATADWRVYHAHEVDEPASMLSANGRAHHTRVHHLCLGLGRPDSCSLLEERADSPCSEEQPPS
jgi:hypothetical protein